MTEHNFKEVLEEMNQVETDGMIMLSVPMMSEDIKTIQTALRLADRLQRGDVSNAMLLASDGQHECHAHLSDEDASMIFKAMAKQMMKEVCDD